MGTFFQIVAILPAIFDAIKHTENAVPVPGQGAAKLAFVLGMLQDTVGDISALVEPIRRIVGRVVTLLKAVGLFKSGGVS